jgi:ElaB/YqjD/DUF883 family membrane-anchored ribosome-binding protein
MKQNGGSNLSDELHQLASEAEALVGTSGEDMTEKARELRERLADLLEVMKDTFGDLEERATEGLKEVDKSIRKNPYPAIGVALGLGLAAGLLLKRK